MKAAWLVFGALTLGGCQTEEYPAPILGTTYRIGQDVPAEGSELTLDILTTFAECANAKVDDVGACMPLADRAAGEVRLGFQLRDPVSGSPVPKSLTVDQLTVAHDGKGQTDIELVPHEPVQGGQLFILVIDGSGSMHENGGERIQKVYEALTDEEVIAGFFPGAETRSGVVLLRFSDKVTGLDGGPPRVVRTPKDYRQMVREHLLTKTGGFTHLYDALTYSTTTLLSQPEVEGFLKVTGAEPTVVLLTDGFNNQAGSDTCSTNVDRLQVTLDRLREVRSAPGARFRPVVYGIGLGVPYRPGSKPEGLNQKVSVSGLCGPFGDNPIDSGLEDVGIDHVSLQWLAEAGGGRSYVRRDSKRLAEVFRDTAAVRYRWFEVKYRVPDSFYHRKSFEVQLRLENLARAYTTVMLYPHPLLDAPGGELLPGERWVRPTSFARSLGVLLPALGLLVAGLFVGPSVFNVRRAIFRRARPRSRS